MLENLRIALRKQKKLILIFFLTIFLPALTLSVFGVRAIRNERFRLAKQEENEGRRAARSIKAHVQSKLGDLSRGLDEMARDPAFIQRDNAAIRERIEKRLAVEPLIDQALLIYKNEEPLFPLLLVLPDQKPVVSRKAADASLISGIRRAEGLEFVEKNYRAAAALYREFHRTASGRDLKAEMLTGQARCFQKGRDYGGAARAYAQIASEYSDCLTSSGLPLGILARLQSVECFKRSGDFKQAAKYGLELFRELLKKPSALSEDQFKTYATLAVEAIDSLLAGEEGAQVPEEIRKEYADIKKLVAGRMKEWEAVGLIQKEIIPELAQVVSQSGGYGSKLYRLSKNVGGKDLLFLAAWIPDKDGKGSAGLLGVQLSGEYLLERVLPEALGNTQLNEDAEVIFADLSGRPLSGKKDSSATLPLVTEYFEDNFPPWKIEFFQAPVRGLETLDLRRNFYFWTILTLIIVLAFGAFLIARTIGHELQVLKIKSDFVSSVSHEFKTPLTSIRSLMERLVDGKVRDGAKMDQYFSIIAQDTDRLTRLVNNLLDFSKIEEGKKEYEYSDTDVVRVATEQVKGFKKEQVLAGPDIRLEVAGEIPIIRADADALSRALANLLSNAVKFTPAGKAIRVGLSSDGENVILEVEDEGIGIHPDEVGKVFEKFFQGRNALDRSARGTGLGLTLVKHAVEAHGGRILVESRLGLGSKFSLIFPIKP